MTHTTKHRLTMNTHRREGLGEVEVMVAVMAMVSVIRERFWKDFFPASLLLFFFFFGHAMRLAGS